MESGARVAAGTQRTVADSRIAAAVALAAASATAPTAAPAASSGVPVLSGQDKDNVKSFLKLSAVLDQTSDEEFQLMSRAEAEQLLQSLRHALGWCSPGRPKHVVTHGYVHYADFGVFGPHAIRMMRKLRLTDGAYAWTVR